MDSVMRMIFENKTYWPSYEPELYSVTKNNILKVATSVRKREYSVQS